MELKKSWEEEQKDTLRRNPRVAAHLICQSLGYFTPRAAAVAIISHRENKPYACEWYSHLAQFEPNSTGMWDDKALLNVSRRIMRSAFQSRRHHKGYMADYSLAKRLVANSIGGDDPLFASWF